MGGARSGMIRERRAEDNPRLLEVPSPSPVRVAALPGLEGWVCREGAHGRGNSSHTPDSSGVACP
ncbi:hypothetical protein DAETH_33300 (plasmid) [Deinococcus aetherius]|uniref:Uncharacterized protein n=1 Tax=Deinococcus aetherius TaxID=200252 RepID=A0ABM8AHW8_9DEIO|nr:hypothetical protein DAETH_33300 [Deinococcus aetherius]